jgi:hypothetical protein
MYARFASINELPISESDRELRWPLGHRPDDYPGSTAWGCRESPFHASKEVNHFHRNTHPH